MALAGFIVAFFLIAFQPFQIYINSWYSFWAVAGFGLVTFVMGMVPEILYGNWVRQKFSRKKQYVIMIGSYILFIALGNVAYNGFLMGQFNHVGVNTVLSSIAYTFLVAIIPTTFFFFYANLMERRKMESVLAEKESAQDPLQQETTFTFRGQGKSEWLKLPLSRVLFLKAQDNYVLIYYYDLESTKSSILRTTLKQLESELPPAHFLRCHRSYLVHLAKVTRLERSGNQAKLHLMDTDEVVAVSKRYLDKVMGQLNKGRKLEFDE